MLRFAANVSESHSDSVAVSFRGDVLEQPAIIDALHIRSSRTASRRNAPFSDIFSHQRRANP
jgi:hypothetical protein